MINSEENKTLLILPDNIPGYIAPEVKVGKSKDGYWARIDFANGEGVAVTECIDIPDALHLLSYALTAALVRGMKTGEHE